MNKTFTSELIELLARYGKAEELDMLEEKLAYSIELHLWQMGLVKDFNMEDEPPMPPPPDPPGEQK